MKAFEVWLGVAGWGGGVVKDDYRPPQTASNFTASHLSLRPHSPPIHTKDEHVYCGFCSTNANCSNWISSLSDFSS